jgi:hypothetical protein
VSEPWFPDWGRYRPGRPGRPSKGSWDRFQWLSLEAWESADDWEYITASDDPAVECIRRTGSIAGSSLGSVAKSGDGYGRSVK